MGKQIKVVMKVPMEDAKKRTKVLKTAVQLAGVISAQIDGEKIVVVGDGIDSVALTLMLRKKMKFAELVSVEAADKKKKKDEDAKSAVVPTIWAYGGAAMAPQTYTYPTRNNPYYDPCSIL